jgi:hypothetical protein
MKPAYDTSVDLNFMAQNRVHLQVMILSLVKERASGSPFKFKATLFRHSFGGYVWQHHGKL